MKKFIHTGIKDFSISISILILSTLNILTAIIFFFELHLDHPVLTIFYSKPLIYTLFSITIGILVVHLINKNKNAASSMTVVHKSPYVETTDEYHSVVMNKLKITDKKLFYAVIQMYDTNGKKWFEVSKLHSKLDIDKTEFASYLKTHSGLFQYGKSKTGVNVVRLHNNIIFILDEAFKQQKLTA